MKFLERIKDYILPYILTLTLCSSIFKIYDGRTFTVYNFALVIMVTAMFIFLDFMQRHKVAGAFIYIVLAFVSLSVMMRFVYSGDGGASYSKWFLSAGEEQKFQSRYFLAFLSAFPFFFSTIVFYFSSVLYRSSFLMLSSLIPCAVYVKVLSDMNDTYLICIAGLNAAIYTINTNKNRIGDSIHYGKKAYILSVAAAVAVTLLTASLIPKQGEAKYYDKFEKYFMDAGLGEGEDFAALYDRSSDAGTFRNLSYAPLYDVYAAEPLYFRRQVFDIYSKNENCFFPLEKYGSPHYKNADVVFGQKDKINMDMMLGAMKKGYELDPSLGIPSGLLYSEGIGDTGINVRIVPVDGHNANYLLTASRTFDFTHSVSKNILRFTLHGQAFSGRYLIPSNKGSVNIVCYSENVAYDKWFESGGADFTGESYAEYIEKLKWVLYENGENELYLTAEAFGDEFMYAEEYKNDCDFNNEEIPEDIAGLGRTLTQNCLYDWQKAQVLRDYFTSGSYTYDLDYEPPEGSDTPSYFVFNSKRGTCSDFASAYTLAARAAGLTVRYAEGFRHNFMNGNDSYRILKKDAHAFPETYIPNTGWVIFDPTASAANINLNQSAYSRGNNGANMNLNFSIDTRLLVTSVRAVCILLFTAAIIIIAVPFSIKIYDNIRIRRKGAEGIMIAYRRICSAAGKRLGIPAETLAPNELREEILKGTGTDLAEFITLYENVCFGGAVPSKEQNEFVYQTFRETVKIMKKAAKSHK